MSVDPWMEAWPRRAMMPPPGRPMLPSSCCRTPPARMIWTPGGVLGPADGVDRAPWSARARSSRTASRPPARSVPGCSRRCRRPSRACSARSAACSIWKTQCGSCSVGSRCDLPGLAHRRRCCPATSGRWPRRLCRARGRPSGPSAPSAARRPRRRSSSSPLRLLVAPVPLAGVVVARLGVVAAENRPSRSSVSSNRSSMIVEALVYASTYSLN